VLRGSPRLVLLCVASLVVVGGASVTVGLLRHQALIAVGLGVLAVAVGIARGVRIAKWAGIAIGLVALLPGAYGLFGLAVVVQDFAGCADRGMASLVATSYPEGYCAGVNWVTQFGTGLGMIAVGVVGLITLATLVRHDGWFVA
jgi:hypothetical protein